jgi:hypothetical protein
VGDNPRNLNQLVVFIHKISAVTAADPRVEVDVYVDLSDIRFVQALPNDGTDSLPPRIRRSALTITNFIAD